MRRALKIGFLGGAIIAAVVLGARSREGTRQSIDRPPPALPSPTAASPPPQRLASSPSPPGVGQVATRAAANEGFLLLEMRALVKTDPARAEALARESRTRFSDGDTSDERDALLVDALINQQRIGAARDETYYYVWHHPAGRFAEHLFTMTGVHPTPRGPSK